MADDLAEQLRLQKESLSTLLDHMPALTFTKDVETGVYLACNQAFAAYAHKPTPEEVVGLTDYQIFEQPVAEHFVQDDRKALSMDEPYVFYEDVADAAGNPRQFQTTKLKFHDTHGRLCLLGMSMDVTEMQKVKQEREEAQAAYQQAENTREVYESIVTALTEDYFNVYYVDLDTSEYIEYGFRTDTGQRADERRGTDFFEECRKNALIFIHEDDQKRFANSMQKDALLQEIEKHGVFIMQYRLILDGKPTYVNLKATQGKGDTHHIVIGVSNIDAQLKDRIAAQRAREDRKAYLRIGALNNNLIVLYLIDEEDDTYTEFEATSDYDGLGIEKQGSDFFGTTHKNSERTVHPDDLEGFHSTVTKQNILSAIERDGVFSHAYRLIYGGLPTYVRLKAAKVEEDGKSTLVVGLLNEDAQIRQEQKYAQEISDARQMATRDALTGVKNMHAFNEAESRMDERIRQGDVSGFSVAVFDLNNLKLINDTRGHEVGDAYIKEACRLICTCFKHSPVFRIGGDEFAAILEGTDYENRDELFERFEKQILENLDRDKTVVAFGYSDFAPGQDGVMRMVFERADSMMYQEKMLLKSLGAAATDESGARTSTLGFGETTVVNMRRHILIADDIEINREILGDLLEDDYDIYYAANGVEAMDILRRHKDEIALVILDLYMPEMNGREVMTQMQVDEDLMFIPVIFISIDLQAELDCLQIGAMDFISKPYPDIEIIKARIARCIELSENRDLIRRTQKDKLTGLLNRDFFLRYVQRYDQHYKETSFDAVVCNVNKFSSLIEQYGRQFADLVLRSIGMGINALARRTGGIGCRSERDAFWLYCPHQDNYEQLLRKFLDDLFFEEETANKVTMRFGVFAHAQAEPDIEQRFEHAQKAADCVGKDPNAFFSLIEGDEI